MNLARRAVLALTLTVGSVLGLALPAAAFPNGTYSMHTSCGVHVEFSHNHANSKERIFGIVNTSTWGRYIRIHGIGDFYLNPNVRFNIVTGEKVAWDGYTWGGPNCSATGNYWSLNQIAGM